MGNVPAKVASFPHSANGVVVSTRSDPPEGYVVMQDVGIVTANSTTFTRNGGENQCMMQVLNLARKECQKLGGNYVLGVHFEIKQFGDAGGWMVYSLTGMACVVKKRTVVPPPSSSAPSVSNATTTNSQSIETVVPIATATVLLDDNNSGPNTRPAAYAPTTATTTTTNAHAPYNPYANEQHINL